MLFTFKKLYYQGLVLPQFEFCQNRNYRKLMIFFFFFKFQEQNKVHKKQKKKKKQLESLPDNGAKIWCAVAGNQK